MVLGTGMWQELGTEGGWGCGLCGGMMATEVDNKLLLDNELLEVEAWTPVVSGADVVQREDIAVRSAESGSRRATG